MALVSVVGLIYLRMVYKALSGWWESFEGFIVCRKRLKSCLLLVCCDAGLFLTDISLVLMDGHGQPALLYLVPCTLGNEVDVFPWILLFLVIFNLCSTEVFPCFFCLNFAYRCCHSFKFVPWRVQRHVVDNKI